MSTVVLEPSLGIDKHALISTLKAQGIDVRPFFHPLSAIPAFHDDPESAKARARNTVAYTIAPLGINLPSALRLDRNAVKRVCEVLRAGVASGPANDKER
jgi:dTDP-4-amino-4,6-dideoxygalactose transaminase